MTYGERLRKRWIVVRLLPDCQHINVAYFFKYTDALGFAQIVQRLDPTNRFEVMFEAVKPAIEQPAIEPAISVEPCEAQVEN